MPQLASPHQILNRIIYKNQLKIERSFKSNFILGAYGGAFIAIAGLFYIIISAGDTAIFYGLKKLLGSLVFTTGFVLVLVGGADIYTSNTMLAINVINKKMSASAFSKNLMNVYFANFIGAMIFLAFVILGKVHLQGGGVVADSILHIGSAKMQHGFIEALSLGILCNFLVCLAFWMSMGSETAIGKISSLMLPIAAFVAGGFEHSVANMFLLPLALFVKEALPMDLWSAIGAQASDYAHINFYNAIVNNLIPVTIGNFIGGAIFVGAFYNLAYGQKD
ncbi:MAG: formate/nitrite transporter family protein [Alphaproteobacteria bacterium]